MAVLSFFLMPIAIIAVVALLLMMAFGDQALAPRIAQYGALAWLGISVIAGTVLVVSALAQDEVSIVTSIMPVMPSTDIPGMTVEIPPSATIISADALWATYTVTGLSWWPRLLFALSAGLGALVSAYLSWIVYTVARNLRTDSPFAGISTHLIRFGLVLFLIEFISQMAEGFANALAGAEALMISGYSYTGEDPVILGMIEEGRLPFPDWPFPGMVLGEFSLAPIGFAVVLILLGMVFRAGEKLSHDTEGLI